ncbi:TPA: glycosyltransferase family 4 protein, partial [Bacillus cereus]
KITIISHKVIYKNNKGYCSSGGFIRAVDGFLSRFDEVIVCAPVKEVEDSFSGEYFDGKIRFNELPYSKGKIAKLISMPKIFLKIKKYLKDWDIVQLRLPSYVSLIAFFVMKTHNKKSRYFNYVGGDTFSGNLYSIGNPVLKILLLPIIFLWQCIDSLIIRSSLTFVTGDALATKYKKFNVKKIISTTLYLEDIKEASKTVDFNEHIELLFVGRLSKEKGIKYLVGAVRILKDAGYKISLKAVGDGNYKNELLQEIESLGVQKEIELLGGINNRELLLDLYANADIFILPSLTEGTPKVLIEAMSQGTPVIASEVGGIPGVVKHRENGLLVKPGNEEEIASAILDLHSDINLTQTLIRNGIEVAKKNTLESLTDFFVREIKENNI